MAKITTSSFKKGSALSARLQTLRSYHTNQKHIWDIGCDHGLLGLSFTHDDVETINLVDPSGPVIERLILRIKDSDIPMHKINIFQNEGQKLNVSEKSNIFFIAGMGGKEIGEIIQNLHPQVDESSKIVVSPHRKILELRELLHSLPLFLEHEEVIEEAGQFYQILSLSKNVDEKVSLYGDTLWKTAVGKKYLGHQIKHFLNHQDLASRGYVTYLKSLSY